MRASSMAPSLLSSTGCGKSTFMRRMTGIFGGSPKPPAGGNPDSNTLISDMTTVICLDDYHCLDRNGRKVKNVSMPGKTIRSIEAFRRFMVWIFKQVTALAPEAQNFDLMYNQVKDLKV